jgi:hypothetical protein
VTAASQERFVLLPLHFLSRTPGCRGFEWTPCDTTTVSELRIEEADLTASEFRAFEGDRAAGELRASEIATVERGVRKVEVKTTPGGRSAGVTTAQTSFCTKPLGRRTSLNQWGSCC